MISCPVCRTEPNGDSDRKKRGFQNRITCACSRLDIEVESNGHWTMRWFPNMGHSQPALTVSPCQMLLTDYTMRSEKRKRLRWVNNPSEMEEIVLWTIELAWVEHLMIE